VEGEQPDTEESDKRHEHFTSAYWLAIEAMEVIPAISPLGLAAKAAVVREFPPEDGITPDELIASLAADCIRFGALPDPDNPDASTLEEPPPDHKFRQPEWVAPRGLSYNSTVKQGLFVMLDLISVIRRETAAEVKRGEAEKDCDLAIDLSVVEGFCDKLEFVIDSLDHTQEFYRNYFLRLEEARI
jgi:hypothetical protein